MYCAKCGAKLDQDAVFCSNCGFPVEKEPVANQGTVRVNQKEKDVFSWEDNIPVIPDNRQPKEKKGNKRAWIISIFLTSIIILVTVILVWMLIKPGTYQEDDIIVNPIKSAVMENEEDFENKNTVDKTDTESLEQDDDGKKLLPSRNSEDAGNHEQPEQEKLAESVTPTPQLATPTPQPATSAILYAGSPDLSGLKEVPVIAADATSTITQTKTNNNAMLLFDKKDDTSWQEGVPGYGINESVSFSFDSHHRVKYIAFKLGNWKNDKYYYGNAKPKTMNLVFGDYSGQITFTGERKVEWVEVSPSVTADSMRLEIKDIYPGTNWEDTCITEVTVYAE